jgi:hypothetical protein
MIEITPLKKKKRKTKPKSANDWVETPLAKELREKIEARTWRSLNGKPLLVR